MIPTRWFPFTFLLRLFKNYIVIIYLDLIIKYTIIEEFIKWSFHLEDLKLIFQYFPENVVEELVLPVTQNLFYLQVSYKLKYR